jgi:3-hydroxyisobutyrate dehydrogenase-like beta-hydroxyacid dehydrogenase
VKKSDRARGGELGRDCARGVEFVITMLPSSPHVRTAYGEYGILAVSRPARGSWTARP